MEHQNHSSTTSARPFGLPLVGWIALAGIAAALVAIFVFNVATDKVLIAGLVGLMLFSHLFMHGGHGSHGGHNNQAQRGEASADGPAREKSPTSKDDPTGQSGGCH